MIHRTFTPNPGVAHLIDHYWYMKIDLNSPIQHHYATPLLEGLAFNFDRLTQYHNYDNKVYNLDKKVYFMSQAVSPRIAETSSRGIDILGVKFHPLAMARLTGINMEHLANRIVAAEDIWGNEIEWLCDEMQSARSIENAILVLERFLIQKYFNTKMHYRMDTVENAIALMSAHPGMMTIREIQVQTNTSQKTFERAFKEFVGITPKLYSAILRYNHAKTVIDNSPHLDIADLSYRLGYFDNSHFAAEFKRFSSYTPVEYSKMARSD